MDEGNPLKRKLPGSVTWKGKKYPLLDIKVKIAKMDSAQLNHGSYNLSPTFVQSHRIPDDNRKNDLAPVKEVLDSPRKHYLSSLLELGDKGKQGEKVTVTNILECKETRISSVKDLVENRFNHHNLANNPATSSTYTEDGEESLSKDEVRQQQTLSTDDISESNIMVQVPAVGDITMEQNLLEQSMSYSACGKDSQEIVCTDQAYSHQNHSSNDLDKNKDMPPSDTRLEGSIQCNLSSTRYGSSLDEENGMIFSRDQVLQRSISTTDTGESHEMASELVVPESPVTHNLSNLLRSGSTVNEDDDEILTTNLGNTAGCMDSVEDIEPLSPPTSNGRYSVPPITVPCSFDVVSKTCLQVQGNHDVDPPVDSSLKSENVCVQEIDDIRQSIPEPRAHVRNAQKQCNMCEVEGDNRVTTVTSTPDLNAVDSPTVPDAVLRLSSQKANLEQVISELDTRNKELVKDCINLKNIVNMLLLQKKGETETISRGVQINMDLSLRPERTVGRESLYGMTIDSSSVGCQTSFEDAAPVVPPLNQQKDLRSTACQTSAEIEVAIQGGTNISYTSGVKVMQEERASNDHGSIPVQPLCPAATTLLKERAGLSHQNIRFPSSQVVLHPSTNYHTNLSQRGQVQWNTSSFTWPPTYSYLAFHYTPMTVSTASQLGSYQNMTAPGSAAFQHVGRPVNSDTNASCGLPSVTMPMSVPANYRFSGHNLGVHMQTVNQHITGRAASVPYGTQRPNLSNYSGALTSQASQPAVGHHGLGHKTAHQVYLSQTQQTSPHQGSAYLLWKGEETSSHRPSQVSSPVVTNQRLGQTISQPVSSDISHQTSQNTMNLPIYARQQHSLLDRARQVSLQGVTSLHAQESHLSRGLPRPETLNAQYNGSGPQAQESPKQMTTGMSLNAEVVDATATKGSEKSLLTRMPIILSGNEKTLGKTQNSGIDKSNSGFASSRVAFSAQWPEQQNRQTLCQSLPMVLNGESCCLSEHVGQTQDAIRAAVVGGSAKQRISSLKVTTGLQVTKLDAVNMKETSSHLTGPVTSVSATIHQSHAGSLPLSQTQSFTHPVTGLGHFQSISKDVLTSTVDTSPVSKKNLTGDPQQGKTINDPLKTSVTPLDDTIEKLVALQELISSTGGAASQSAGHIAPISGRKTILGGDVTDDVQFALPNAARNTKFTRKNTTTGTATADATDEDHENVSIASGVSEAPLTERAARMSEKQTADVGDEYVGYKGTEEKWGTHKALESGVDGDKLCSPQKIGNMEGMHANKMQGDPKLVRCIEGVNKQYSVQALRKENLVTLNCRLPAACSNVSTHNTPDQKCEQATWRSNSTGSAICNSNLKWNGHNDHINDKENSESFNKFLPRPVVTANVVSGEVVLMWDLPDSSDTSNIAAFELFVAISRKESSGLPVARPAWIKIGSVKRLQLPMACKLSDIHQSSSQYLFFVRAVGVSGMFGPSSNPCEL